MMGELPAARTRLARPFSITGVDFADPLLTKKETKENQHK